MIVGWVSEYVAFRFHDEAALFGDVDRLLLGHAVQLGVVAGFISDMIDDTEYATRLQCGVDTLHEGCRRRNAPADDHVMQIHGRDREIDGAGRDRWARQIFIYAN